ncbi:MAG TPA: prepilin-type N-terminal cleavage/methylation domain-containing protein [Ignavibacteriaceae bacterium]|nr:prepilin-type N-terminal cleavage/methylation domain-containing protein [Ignavibacteriaceae bacterium]
MIFSNSKDGFALIEVIVSIVILGIILSLTSMMFMDLFKPKVMLKSEAVLLLNDEINKIDAVKEIKDTTFLYKNIILERKVIDSSSFYYITITLNTRDSNIIFFETFIKPHEGE